jgi:hypothetical protein
MAQKRASAVVASQPDGPPVTAESTPLVEAGCEEQGVLWEYSYSRFGVWNGPHQVRAGSLAEAKDQIRRRHNLPDYRCIRVNPAA